MLLLQCPQQDIVLCSEVSFGHQRPYNFHNTTLPTRALYTSGLMWIFLLLYACSMVFLFNSTSLVVRRWWCASCPLHLALQSLQSQGSIAVFDCRKHACSRISILSSALSCPMYSFAAEYSKSLMREAKAHFEGTAEAATLAEPPAAPSTSSETSSAAFTVGEPPRAAGSGGLHLASRDNFSSGALASQPADAPDNRPSNTLQIGRDADTPAAAPRNPRTALAAAHKATKQPGSSTALVLQFPEGSNTIKASNLVRLPADHHLLQASVALMFALCSTGEPFKLQSFVCRAWDCHADCLTSDIVLAGRLMSTHC